MLTEEQITYVMHELGLDPGDIRAKQTIKLIAASKPDGQIDARFINSLRADLLEKANVISATRSLRSKSQNNYFSIYMNKILASALVVALVLVAGGLWYIQQTDRPLFTLNQQGADTQLLSGEYGVTGVGNESFGDLAKLTVATAARGGSAGLNGAGEMAEAPTQIPDRQVADITGNNATGISLGGDQKPLIWPGPMNFDFRYEGQDLPQLAQDQSVLKRTRPVQIPSVVDRIVSLMSFGLIDMSKFRDLKIQNFSFVEDREFGYGINVDVQNGFVNIYQNWEKWPQQDVPTCLALEICPPQNNLTINELPSDEESIQIANRFLNDYNVSREGYGAPFVQDAWRTYYERTEDKTNYYIPEQVQVIFPLVIEGAQVFDEGGNLTGMSVMIDARTRRAISVNELTTKQFERSVYKGETDSNRILEIAERGGFRNYSYEEPGVKKTRLNLDTPTIEMVKIWFSSDDYRTSNELFVPAFVFPVKNWVEAGYYRPNIVVPLVADILDSDVDQGRPIPLSDPMPVEPDGGNGSTSSASPGRDIAEPTMQILPINE